MTDAATLSAGLPGGPEPKPERSLSSTSARGMAWMSANSIVSKVVSTLSQIVLAWLLRPQDFGLIGLAFTVAAIAGIFASTGLEDVLVQRQDTFKRWANPAFWISMTASMVGVLAMIIAAPIAVRIYHTHDVLGLILCLSLCFPVSGAALVPTAKLRIDLRFKTMAWLWAGNNLIQSVTTILFAWWGFGAYSFIWPRLISAAFLAGMGWYLAPAPIRLRMQFRLWRRLLRVGASTFSVRVTNLLVSNGDYLTLGLMYPPAIVGAYYFAFNLSTQTTALVVVNFNNVLFPALCRLQDDVNRQARAMLRGLKVLAAIAVPCSFLQAALAGPAIHVLFQPKWYPAIPILQILSVGMAFSVFMWPPAALLPAQGRFSVQAITGWIGCVIFFIFVAVGAHYGAGVGAATAVAIYYVINAAITLRASIWPADLGWMHLFASVRGSLFSGSIAVGLATLMRLQLPARLQNGWLAIAVVTPVAAILYCYLLRLTDTEAWQELARRATAVWARLLRITRGSTSPKT